MKIKKTVQLVQFIVVFFIGQVVYSQTFKPEWENLKTHQATPEWFADAKLGVYFHWGIYSVPGYGGEWYPRWMYVPDRVGWGSEIYKQHKATYGKNFHYHDFIKDWKAPNFSAKDWVDLFEGMGAKFIGSIAEHHDGFSLWDSKVNEWNSVKMGPHINMVEQIAAETQKRDLKFMATFHHGFNNIFYPKQENSFARPVTKMLIVQDSVEVPQDEKYRKLYGNMDYDEANDLWLAKLNEVIDGYCPDYIWMDFGQRFIKESHRKQFLENYFNKAKEKNKEVVVNTKGDFFPTELAVINVERATMENIMPDVWITDFILGSAWCYNKEKRTAIDSKKAIRMLAEVVSKNGVMLLSAGPMADGTMPEEQVKAMKDIGAWMKLYGESIYKTRPFIKFGEGTTILKQDPADAWNEYGAIKKGLEKLNAEDIRYTKKGKIIYGIQLGWNQMKADRLLTTFAKSSGLKVSLVSVLGSAEKIKWKQNNSGLQVQQPKQKPLEADAALVYKIVLK
jgi:alpha-L-fucosidase